MGAAVPIIGAGVSLIGGVAQANQRNQEAAAQRSLIANQNAIDQLNAQLSLNQLKLNQQMMTMSRANEDLLSSQQMLNRENQRGLQQAQVNLQYGLAEAQNAASKVLTEAQASQQLTDLETSKAQAKQQIAGQLAQAFASTTEQQQQTIASALQRMSPNEKTNAIKTLMSIATEDGENLALQMLLEPMNVGTGEVDRAVEAGAKANVMAEQQADASQALVDADVGGKQLQTKLQNLTAQNQLQLESGDINASRTVNNAGFASDKVATDYAFALDKSTKSVERMAQDESIASQRYVLSQGAQLSNANAQLQIQNTRGNGFLDYVGAGMNAFTTYRGLGGSMGFLSGGSRQPQQSVIRRGVDVTNSYGNFA